MFTLLLLSSLVSTAKPAAVGAPVGAQSFGKEVTSTSSIRPQWTPRNPCTAAPGETVLFCDDFDEPTLSHADDYRTLLVDGQGLSWHAYNGDWNSRAYIHGCELQYYTQYGVNYAVSGPENFAAPGHQSNFVFDAPSDTLSLVLRREPATLGYIPGWMGEPGGSCWMDFQDVGGQQAEAFDYTSGWIQTPELFRYGTFTTRVRIPNEGRVAWPAFWLFGGEQLEGGLGGQGEGATEIDIFEFTGYDAHMLTHNVHTYYKYTDYLDRYGDPGEDETLEECTAYHWSPTCNFHRDPVADSMITHHGYYQQLYVDVGEWHTYTVEWTPRTLTWFVDGKRAGATQTHDIPDNHMSLILNLALPDWLAHGINNGIVNGHDTSLQTPSSFDIDYVKVTALKDPELVSDWTNGGVDRVDGWYQNADDHHLAGDFDGDGLSELFSLNATSGYANLMDHHPRQFSKGPGQWTWDNATWTTQWSNGGSGSVDWWRLGAPDRFVVGDFIVDADDADELLGIQPLSGYAHLMSYDGDWSTDWSNVGSDAIHWWILNPGDQYIAGNFDGVGPDELLAISEASGHAHMMRHALRGWTTPWATSTGQVASWIFHSDDHYIVADLDNDGADEILAINHRTRWAQVLEYSARGGWQTTWQNRGSGQVKWWMFNPGDQFVAGDFDDQPGEDVLAYNADTGWVQILRYDGDFQHVWGNGGVGRKHVATTMLAGDFGTGSTQVLSLADRHFAWLESYRLPSEVFSME